MKNMFPILIFVFITMVNYAQENHKTSFWGNFGGGLSITDYSRGSGGFSLNYGITGMYDSYIASIKKHNNVEFSFAGPQEKINSTSLLVGLSNSILKGNDVRNTRSLIDINLLVGISYLEVYHRGKQIYSGGFKEEYELNKITSIGFPCELNAELRFTPYVGLSITLFSNLNKYNNLFGTSINLIIGCL